MCCRDTTKEKVTFPISPELLKAIHKCERVTALKKAQSLLSNWGFTGFMKTTTYQVLDEVSFTKAQKFYVDITQQENHRDYLLRGELLVVTSIFYCQMNEMVWLPEEDQYMAKPIYKEGFLTATVVTFIYGKVHIVQVTYNPLEPYPTLTLMLRAIYNLGKDNYSKNVAFNVLKWIFSPSELAKELSIRGKK